MGFNSGFKGLKSNSGFFPCAQQLERANGHSSSSTLEVKNEQS